MNGKNKVNRLAAPRVKKSFRPGICVDLDLPSEGCS